MNNRNVHWAAIVIIPLLLMAAILVLNSLDFNHFKPTITAKVEEATGRTLSIAGDIELQLSLSPELSMEGLALSNAAWGSDKEMITIRRVVTQVNLWSLFGEELEILHLLLEQPNFLLESSADGIDNWVMGKTEQAAVQRMDQSGGVPLFRHIEILDGQLTYIDGVNQSREQLTIQMLQATADDFASPLHLQLEGSYNEFPFEITAQLDNLVALNQGKSTQLQLKVKSGHAEGQFSASLLLNGETGQYRIGQIDLQLAQSRLQGEISVDSGKERPILQAALKAPLVDLTELGELVPVQQQEVDSPSADDQAAMPVTGKKLFPSALLDLSGLATFDAEIELNIERLRSPYAVLEGVESQLIIKEGGLQATPLRFQLGGGTVEGDLSVQGGGPVTVALGLEGKGISLGQVLADVGKVDQVEGAVSNFDITLQGQGRSVAALMADLEGEVLLQIGEGKMDNQYLNLTGGDIVSQITRSLNPTAKSEQHTLLQCAVVNLQLKQGVCKFDKNIAIETDMTVIVGSGEFDLGSETLSINMKPSPRQDSADLGIGAGDLVAAARLEGTFALPKLGLDPLGSAKAGMKIYQALATGGTSLILGGLIDKAMSDPHPCKTALEE
ncbi:MAG TPA: AsmA family protein [Gammaproteobacteria bacterium]|jgi:hypothetical protein|nr:AsmA family protein [Gammaproteobacteria bacterium]